MARKMKIGGASAKFRTTILQAGKTATGIEIPPEVMEKLGAGKKPPVRVTIHGKSYQSTVAVMGGKFMVGVSAENREKVGVQGGDVVDVELALDAVPREMALPADFAALLNKSAKAKQAYEELAPSKKKAIIVNIEGAKADQTRQRRIEKALGDLQAGG